MIKKSEKNDYDLEVAAPWLKNYEEGVPPHLQYPKISFPALWQKTAAFFPENISLIFGEKKISYRELKKYIDALTCTLLSLGVKKGDRVGLLMPNCPPGIMITYCDLG